MSLVTNFACDVLEEVSIAFVVALGVLAATMPSLGRSAFYFKFTVYSHLGLNCYTGARTVTEKLNPNGYAHKCMYT